MQQEDAIRGGPEWEQRRVSFGTVAELYDSIRPSYPDALFDDVHTYADLAGDDAICEVGAGTGKAAVVFAGWGNPFVAIEPSPEMAAVLRRNVAAFEHVQVLVSTLEDARIAPRSFGMIACAQAWHWLDEATRIDRFAEAIYAYGTAAVIANVQVVPEGYGFWDRVQDVYKKHTPGMEHQGAFRRPHEIPEHPLAGSPLFTDLEQFAHTWEWTLSTTDYLALCTTHSNKAALDADTRRRLLDAIGELIDAEFDGHVTEHYIAVAGVGRKLA